jgi:uncharacterized protein (TIGR03435 family)
MPTISATNRTCKLSLLAIAFVAVAHAHCQAPPATTASPTFDVISVKPNHSGSGGMRMTGVTNSFQGNNITVDDLIFNSYNLTSNDLIFGLPGWARSAHFDIDAKVSNPDKKQMDSLTPEQRKSMLLVILEDRFNFKGHLETKILPVYDLVLAKGGAKFTGGKGPNADTAAAMAKRGLTSTTGGMIVYDGEITASATPVSSLVFGLTGAVGRTVIDKTGLTGNYDFELKWTPEHGDQPTADAGQSDAQSGPSIFTAVEEQLGLKLVPSKGPVQTLVVDHVEMPTEN